MSDIDWSKAPEGATHVALMQNGEPVFYCNVRFDGDDYDGYKFYRAQTGMWVANIGKPSYLPLIPRPSPAWNGEGLPPVGVVCKIPDCMAGGNSFLEQFEGLTVEIVAHTKSVSSDITLAVFKYVGPYGLYRFHGLAHNPGSPNFEVIRAPRANRGG